MAYDPTEPDAIEDLAADIPVIDVEAPEGDSVEQRAVVTPERDDPMTGVDPARGNVADLVEQARVVTLDEEDYR
jgi:hypothetical protein